MDFEVLSLQCHQIVDKKVMEKAGLEYAKREGYEVQLSNLVEYCYWGTNGYAFEVNEK